MTDPLRTFLAESADYLETIHLERLRRAVATLPESDLWWRPHDDCISVGVILRHLEGNVRQWLLSGLGGRADRRERAQEFAGEAEGEGEQLLAALSETVAEAAGLVRGWDVAELGREYRIQGFPVTAMAAILHVVEHFSWHTGQATWIAKARGGAGHGLAFYDEDAINTARNEES